MKKKALALMVSAALAISGLSGCASMPEGYDEPIQQTDLVTQMRDTWSSTPALTQVTSSAGVVVRKHGELPAEVAAKTLQFRATTDMTLKDAIYMLDAQGLQVVGRLSAENAAKPLGISMYVGTLGMLMERIALIADVGYEYRNGLVFITDANRFSVTLPQHKELLDEVVAALTDMGATGVRADLPAGTVSYQAQPSVAEHIETYIESVARNSAMVTLQVAVLTVSLNRNYSLGFDWSSFATEYGTKGFQPGLQTGAGAGLGSGGTGTGTGGVDAVVPDVANAVKQGALAALSSDGLAYRFVSSSFSLSAAIRALSTFGDARTDQNVVLGTLSGVPVSISSGNEIPYVEDIGDRTDSNGNVTGGTTTTATVDSGLSIEVTPHFDASDMTVTTGVKVDMSSLIGFRELSAGNALGTLSRPEMQKLTFENLSRLQAGETIIIGGITYDQLSDNYTSFPGLEKAPVGSESKKANRNAIFIVIRPSVVIFGNAPESAKAALAAAQAAREAREAADKALRIEPETAPSTTQEAR